MFVTLLNAYGLIVCISIGAVKVLLNRFARISRHELKQCAAIHDLPKLPAKVVAPLYVKVLKYEHIKLWTLAPDLVSTHTIAIKLFHELGYRYAAVFIKSIVLYVLW